VTRTITTNQNIGFFVFLMVGDGANSASDKGTSKGQIEGTIPMLVVNRDVMLLSNPARLPKPLVDRMLGQAFL
jgi:hypothetical protein